ncbi:MAG TPA: pyridoxal phosphate-dependent aminotransferase [Candidatus Acidoferrales bacterium]|jgi:alanine-synthesizing transaminase|nr:pyridoxal phosphate-dependent aminotransferase [Candidatus Acidoferrales bacterium]
MFAGRTNWNLKSNRLSEALAGHRAAAKPLLDLTASNPTECGFDYDRQAILQALSNPESLSYQPDPKGLLSARLAVAGYYSGREIMIPAEDMILTTSTSEAYSFAFRVLCNPGDELLIPEPSYPLFSFLADIQDVKLVGYPLLYDHGWQIDFHALQRAVTERTRGIIVVNPNNPTGHFCKSGEMEKLNEICSPRQIAVIADEVFLDFSLAETTTHSFAANDGCLTFTTSGLSKISGLPQMKAAWLIASGPEESKAQALARLEVIADTFLSTNAPVQLALPVFLELRHGFQKQVMARVRKNLAELDAQLSAQNSCERLEVEGGWYALLRVPAVRSDEDLAIDVLNTKGVCVHPGHFFDFPADGYLIVSLITPERDFNEGIKRLLSMF